MLGAGSLIASQIDGQVARCVQTAIQEWPATWATSVIAGLVLKVAAVCGGQPGFILQAEAGDRGGAGGRRTRVTGN